MIIFVIWNITMILRVKAVQKVCPKIQGCPKEVLLRTSSPLPQTPSRILSTSSHPLLTGNNLISSWFVFPVFLSHRGMYVFSYTSFLRER